MLPEQQPSLRVYALNNQVFPDQAADLSETTFADLVIAVFSAFTRFVYGDYEITADSGFYGESMATLLQAVDRDAGDVAFEIRYDDEEPLNVLMPPTTRVSDMVPYALFALLAYSWYGQQVRVMCANVPEWVWQRAVYSFEMLLGQMGPLDGRVGSAKNGLVLHLTPHPLKLDGPYVLDGFNTQPDPQGLRTALLLNAGLIPSEEVTQVSYEDFHLGYKRIKASYPKPQPALDSADALSVVRDEPAEEEVVPTADPVDELYHSAFGAAKGRLLETGRTLVLHSPGGVYGTGKTRIAQQLAVALAVPYIYATRLLTDDDELTPGVAFAWANGGLIHFQGTADEQRDLQAFVQGLQLYSVTHPNRPARHEQCYLVVETHAYQKMHTYNPVLSTLLARHALRVDVDVHLEQLLLPVQGKNREVVESLLEALRVTGARISQKHTGLHPVAEFRRLLDTWETPREAAEQLVLRCELFTPDERGEMLRRVFTMSGAAASKKPKASRSKAKTAKAAEDASPQEQAQALASIVAPALGPDSVITAFPELAPVAAQEEEFDFD